MRTIEIFKFSELTPAAQATAIREHKWEMQEKESFEALRWALDDCSLWEPTHQEMTAALGSDYYERNRTPDGKYGQFVFANRRNPLKVDVEMRYLQFGKSLEITNTPMFLTWLGIPSEFHSQVEWEIIDARGSNSELVLSMEIDESDPREGEFRQMLKTACDKFEAHVQKCIDRIEIGIEEYFSNENVADRLSGSQKEFTSAGQVIEVSIA